MADKDSKNEELLEQIREDFDLAADAESEQRDGMLGDMVFEAGEQWDEKTRSIRDNDNRPSLVINKVAGMVKQLNGVMRQTRTGIKTRPVDSKSDPEVAEVFNGLIRNIENTSDAENAYDGSGFDALRCGLGYFRVLTDYVDDSAFDQEILIEPIENVFTVYRDPYSTKVDGSDARFYFITEMISKDMYEEQYPGKSIVSGEGEYDDSWISDAEIRVAEYWWVEEVEQTLALLIDGRTVSSHDVELDELQEGIIKRTRKGTRNVVKHCVTNGYELLEEPVEWAGKFIPVIPVCGEIVWIEGKRYYRSAFAHAKDAQRMYNWSRSLAAETLAMAPRQPFITTPEAIEGYELMWEMSNQKPTPYLLHNDNTETPQRQPPAFPDQSAMMETAASSEDIKSTTGIYDASLGARGNETSGRAIVARQQQGETSTYVFQDNRVKARKFLGRILVDLIPKVYDAERVVRLLNEDGSEGWAQINQKDQVSGQTLNDLSVGRYDIVVDTGVNHATQRLESADAMVELVRSFPRAAGVVAPRLAKLLDWEGADEIAEELKALSQPQQPPPDPMLEQLKQLKLQNEGLDVAKKQQDLQIDGGKAQGDMMTNQSDLQTSQVNNAKTQSETALNMQELQDKRIADIVTSTMQQFLGR